MKINPQQSPEPSGLVLGHPNSKLKLTQNGINGGILYFLPFYLVWGGTLIIKEVFILCSGCEMEFMFYHKCSLQNWLASGNSGVLVPHVSSSAFISDFKWHGIKSIRLTLIQSLGKPPLLSQEHKPVTCINPTMKAGNVQNSARIRFAHGPGRMNSPTEKEVFFISSQPGKSFPQHCKYLISGTL